MSSSSNRNKNFRRRSDSTTTETPPSSTTTTTTKASSTIKPKKKLLSFADDEDETPNTTTTTPAPKSKPPKLLSSSSSHKHISTKHRLATTTTTTTTPSPIPTNITPQLGEYTKEKLQELQKNTRTLTSTRSTITTTTTATTSAANPTFILRGLVKPIDDSTEIEENVVVGGSRVGESGRKKGENGPGSGSGAGGGAGAGAIPDQATINAIRAKREKLRQSKAVAPAQEYISLDTGSNHGEVEGISDEEPEFVNRITMIGGKSRNETGKKGVFEEMGDEVEEEMGRVRVCEVVVEESVDEEDEEEKRWEEEQCRKGLGKRIDGVGGVSQDVSRPVQGPQQYQQGSVGFTGYGYQQGSSGGYGVQGVDVGGVSGGIEVMSIVQKAEIASKALQDSIKRLKESHERTVSSLSRADSNLYDSLSNITALEKSASAAGEKFIFMQKLRDFVSVICDFLQHKAPYIEEIEDQMQDLHTIRASALLERRAADNADEMAEIETGISAAISAFSKGGGTAAIVAATAVQPKLPVQLDEFGRDVNLQRRMDMARRAEARKRRKTKSESRRMASKGDKRVEGESSTDESDSESTSYRSNRDLLLQEAIKLFSDAADEYSQLSVVKERFESWKELYSSGYRDAYISLSIPAIFSPYVRLELLKWDPLYEDVRFDNMEWHSLLFNYGLPKNESDFNPNDADANLIPELVEKLALPILHHQIAQCWDMLSGKGTHRAVLATELVITYVPATSKALRGLLAVIHTRLADAVGNLEIPSWAPHVVKTVPNAAGVVAYRFGTAIRLLRNICMWKNILALPVLEHLALDELLIGKVLPHVRSITPNVHDAITRTERIITSLSGVWTGSDGQHSPKLQPLVDYVLLMGRILEKRNASESETHGLACRLKEMLVKLNEYDKAQTISRTFQIRKAL